MAEIKGYEDNSDQESDNVESSEGKSDSGDHERDTHSENGNDDSLSLSICTTNMFVELYDLAAWIDKLGSFLVVRARLAVYCYFRKTLVDQRFYSDFMKNCFSHLRYILEHFKFNE